jgi:hypothetical protein
MKFLSPGKVHWWILAKSALLLQEIRGQPNEYSILKKYLAL